MSESLGDVVVKLRTDFGDTQAKFDELLQKFRDTSARSAEGKAALEQLASAITSLLTPIGELKSAQAEASLSASAFVDSLDKGIAEKFGADTMAEAANAATEMGQAQKDALDALGPELDALETLSADTNEYHKAASQAAEETGNLGRKLNETKEGANQLSGEAEKLSEQLLKMAGFALTAESIKRFGEESLEAYGKIQMATVSLTALTGSADAAAKEIEDLEKLANTDALGFLQILETAKRFDYTRLSVQQVEQAMRVAADSAAATGRSIETVAQRLDMISESGMVSRRMLQSLGINMQDLAIAMGHANAPMEDVSKAFKNLDENARLEVLETAIERIRHLEGTAERAAETIPGQFTRMKNLIEAQMIGFGKDIEGIVGFISSAMKGTLTSFDMLILGVKTTWTLVKDTGEAVMKTLIAVANVSNDVLVDHDVKMAKFDLKKYFEAMEVQSYSTHQKLISDTQETLDRIAKMGEDAAKGTPFAPGAAPKWDTSNAKQREKEQEKERNAEIAAWEKHQIALTNLLKLGLEERQKLDQISAADALAQEAGLARAELQIKQNAIREKIAALPNDPDTPAKKKVLQGELIAAQDAYEAEIVKLRTRGVEAAKKLMEEQQRVAHAMYAYEMTEAKRALSEQSKDWKSYLEEIKKGMEDSEKSAEISANGRVALSRIAYAQEKLMLDEEVSQHKLTADRRLAILSSMLEEQKRLELAAAYVQYDNPDATLSEHEKAYARIQEIRAKYSEQQAKLLEEDVKANRKSTEEISKLWDQVGGTFATVFSDLAFGGKKVSEEITKAFENLAKSIIKELVQGALMQAMNGILGMSSKTTGIFGALVNLIRGTQAVQTTADVAAAAEGAAVRVAAVEGWAGVAAAAAMAAYAAIPFAGLELGAAAAASEIGAIQPFVAMASAAQGFDVPKETLTMLHPQEMVLPADLATGLRGIIRQGRSASTAGGSSDIHNHFEGSSFNGVTENLVNDVMTKAVRSARLSGWKG